MPKLSIVIPVLSDPAALESTLLSVLANRPADCEVLVVLATPYDDPYDLKDEVKFIAAEPRRGLVECINVGLHEASSPLVHVLSSGAEVTDGWTNAAVAHFDDPKVAAVAPLVLAASDRTTPLSAGLRYRVWGARQVNCPQTVPTADGAARISVLGPCLPAAFYRLSAIAQVGGGWCRAVGDELADLDLALALKHAGYQAVFESRSQIYAQTSVAPPKSAFMRGLYAERLFWRNVAGCGWMRSLVSHPVLVMGEFVRALPNMSALTKAAGRFLACCQLGQYRRRPMGNSKLAVKLATMEVAEPMTHRIDGPHSMTRAKEPATVLVQHRKAS